MWLLWLRSKIQRLILVTLNVTLVTLVTLRCANWPKMLSSAHTPVYGAHGFHRFYRIFPKMLEFSQSPERPRLCEILMIFDHFCTVSSSSGQSLLLVDGGPSGLEPFSVPFLSVCASSGQILLLVGGELPIATQ